MTVVKMHADEVSTDASLVRRLLATQFPQWADLPISPVRSSGTDNALYRLGEDKVVRLPRIHWALGQIDKERQWLPRLAPHLPLAIPIQLVKGEPGEGYPWHWSVYRWLDGENATIDQIADPNQAAIALAQFLTALQQIDSTDGPLPGTDDLARGKPLTARDSPTRKAIAALHGMFDTGTVTAAWETALQAPEWNRPPVWIHGDLLTGNLLFQQGRLSAVIDFGALGLGDPACDLMIAWSLFSGASRDTFRKALAIDDATWARGRGWALSVALIFIPYYLNTNPVGVGYARRAIEAVIADYEVNG
ncbi:MAG: aminoglycoside phosphotransferase family protein [Cyanobacteria bacterium J06636_16]